MLQVLCAEVKIHPQFSSSVYKGQIYLFAFFFS